MEQTAEIIWWPVSLRKHPDTDREVLITVQSIQEYRASRYIYSGYYDLKHDCWEFTDGHAMFGKVIAWAEMPTVYTGDTFGI